MLLITGANGFVGRHLAAALLERGERIEVLVRSRHHLELFEEHGVPIHFGSLDDAKVLRRATARATRVVHLAAATDVSRPEVNRAWNVDGTRNLIAALADRPIERVLFFSSTCVIRRRRDAYGETKREGEELFAASGLPTVVFRPTMIYGRGSKEFETFLAAVRRLPVVPMIGAGRNLLQPVALPDAVAASLAALERPGIDGRAYDVAGPEPVAFRELIRETARAMGKRRLTLPVPVFLPLAAAALMGRVMRHTPLSVDQVLAFTQDTEVDVGPARRDLGFAPRPLRRGLEELLGGG